MARGLAGPTWPDCPPGGGANGIIVGSNRLPFTPAEVYGQQFYSGTEATRGDKALPLDKMPNSIGFTLPAGWAAIFDITSWHTALANNGPGARQNRMLCSRHWSASRACAEPSSMSSSRCSFMFDMLERRLLAAVAVLLSCSEEA